ncbi:MAG: hypothetical protein M3O22_00610 [Pseudomonadota bacterium]|nr:hypothetical protein [Pseudomonadota bacterium]
MTAEQADQALKKFARHQAGGTLNEICPLQVQELTIYADNLLEHGRDRDFWDLYRQLLAVDLELAGFRSMDELRKSGLRPRLQNASMFWGFTGRFLIDCFQDPEKKHVPDHIRVKVLGVSGNPSRGPATDTDIFCLEAVVCIALAHIEPKFFKPFASWLSGWSTTMNLVVANALVDLLDGHHPQASLFLAEQFTILENSGQKDFCIGPQAFRNYMEDIFAGFFDNPDGRHGHRLAHTARRIQDRNDLKQELTTFLSSLIGRATSTLAVITAKTFDDVVAVISATENISENLNALATLDTPESPWGIHLRDSVSACCGAVKEKYGVDSQEYREFFENMNGYPDFAPFMKGLERPAGIDSEPPRHGDLRN